MNRAAFASLALLVACSSPTVTSTGGDGGATPSVIPIDQLFSTLTAAACESLFRCPATSESAAARLVLGNTQACSGAFQRLGSADITDLQRGVREARIRYDGAAAARCLDGVRQRCDVSLSLDELCADVFQGTVALGGQCFRHEECAGDAYCQGSGPSCPGTCRPRLAPGAQCEVGRQCSSGGAVPARCHEGAGGMSRCVQLTNGPAAGEGQPCGVLVSEGMNAGQKVTCTAGLYCRAANGSAGTCQRPLTVGSPCRSGDACDGSAFCGGGMCRAATVLTAVGAPCSEMASQLCSPLANLTCVNGACTSIGNGAEGAACMTGDFYETFSCNAGLYCERATRRCAAQRAAGAMCESSRECASGECANGRCLDRQCNLAP